MKHFFRFFTILLVITFSISAKESYGQEVELTVGIGTSTSTSTSITICSGEIVTLFATASVDEIESFYWQYKDASGKWVNFNVEFNAYHLYPFEQIFTSPDSKNARLYRARYFKMGSATEYLTNECSIAIRPGSRAGGLVTRNYTICNGSTPPDLTLIGSIGSNIRWQSSSTTITGTYTDMSPAITSVTLPGSAINKFQTGYYRAIVQNSNCPADTLSPPITVNVTPLSNGGTASISSGTSTICYNTATPAITLSGSVGTVTWQSSNTPGTGFVDIAGTSSPVIDATASKYYRAKAISGVCSVAYSNEVLVTVSQTSSAGTITPVTQTICFNAIPAAITLSSSVGAIQWQSSLTAVGGYSDIAGQTSTTLPSGSISNTTTMYYQAVVTSGVCPSATITATVNVYPASVGGTASITAGTATICYNTTAPTIILADNVGTVQWQWSLTSGGTYTNTTGTSTSPTVDNKLTKYYRAKVTSGVCSVAYSNEVLVTVSQTSSAGTITPVTQTICYNGIPAAITLSSSVGAIQWQSSLTAVGGYNDIAGQTSTTLPSASISNTTTMYYQAVVTSGVCPSATITATVNVNPTTVEGTTSITAGNASICYNTAAPTITLTGSVGTVQWLSSGTLTGTYTNITGTATSPNISNTASAYYKASVRSGVCLTRETTPLLISISPTSTTGTIFPVTATICQNATPTAITLTGYTGTIQWRSTNIAGGTYSDMVGQTGATLPSSAIDNTATGYYQAVVTSGVCPSVIINSTVNVTALSSAGTATITSGNSTICSSTTGPTINLTGTVVGDVQWWERPATSSTLIENNIVGASAPIINTISSKYYKAIVTNGVCPAAISNEVLVTVSQASSAGTISPVTQTICYNGIPAAITLSSSVGAIQWQSSTSPSGSYTNMVGLTSATLLSGSISNTTTMYYQAVVTNGVCPSATITATVNVDPTSVGGTASITAGTATICYNTTAPIITLADNVGTVQWQWSLTSGGTYTNTTGTSISPTVDNKLTKYYRAKVTSGVCSVAYSNEVLVTVSQTSSAGTISPVTQTICYNGIPAAITLSSSVGAIQWQSSLTAVGGYNDIAGQTSTTLPSASISNTTTMYYQAVVTNGVCPSATITATVNVNPASVGGTASITAGTATICYNTTAPTITLADNVGTVQWQWSLTSGGTYTNTTGTSTSPTVDNKLTKYYRAKVTSGVCSVAYSNEVLVTVSQTSSAGTITPVTQTICFNGIPAAITLSGYTGTIQWQSSTSPSGSYTNMVGLTSATLPSGSISNTTTMYYQAVVTSGVCPSATITATVTVNPTTVSGTATLSGTSTICYGTIPGSLPSISLAGNTGLIQWQSSLTSGGTFTNIGGTTSPVIDNVTSKYYRALVTSGVCAAAASNELFVSVDQPSVPGNISPSTQDICIGNSPTPISLTGYAGIIQWQSSTSNNAGTFTNMVGETTSGLLANTIDNNNTKYYQAVVKNGVCPAAYSLIAAVNISQLPVPGTVNLTGNATVCYGTTGAGLPVITLSGATGTIQWQSSSTSNGVYTNTAGTTSPVIDNTGTKYYQAKVSSGPCASATSIPIVVNVDPLSVQGFISNPTPRICQAAVPAALTLSGYVGTIQWQSASPGGTYSNMSGLTSATLPSGSISNTTTMYYQAVVTNGVCPSATVSSTVTVDPTSAAGTASLAGTSTVCYGTATVSLPVITLAGNVGAIQWQSATSIGGTYSNASGTNSPVIDNTASKYYRAIVTSGVCNADNSNAILVSVDPTSQVSPITLAQKVQQWCIGSPATAVTLPGYTGTIIWKTATSIGGTYNTIGGETTATLPAANIPTTAAGVLYYKAVVTSGVCPSAESEIVSVQTDALTVAGSIASTSNLICNGSTPPTISLTGNTGSTIKWQTRLASATYVDPIPSQTGSSISSVVNNSAPASSQVVNYYQAIVKSGACNSLTTNEVMVAIDPTSQVSPITLAQKVQQWCIGSPATAVTLPGYTGTIIWKTATSLGGTYNTIGGETTATLPAANIPTTAAGVLYYKAVVTSGVCPSAESEIVSVQTDALTVAGSIASASNLICNGSTPPTISLTGNTGSTIKWQTRLASATYVDPIPSQTGSSISSVVNNSAPASSQVVNYYQAIVKSGACNPLTTNEVAVAVDPSSQVGLIEPLQKNQEICIGSSATSVVLPSHTGTIQWQTANLGGSYTDMTGLTNATLLFGNIATNVSGTKIYRAQVTSGVCPAIYSEIASVRVDATTVAGDIYFLNGNSSICNLGDKPTISIKNNTGTSIVWQITTVSNSNSIIGTANSLDYTNTNNTGNLLNSGIDNTASGAISSFKYYRASVRNGACKTEFTQPIELEVIPTPIVTKVVPAERCGLGNVEILAESNLGLPNWFEANSGGAAIVSANTFITPLLNSSTNYYAGAIFRGCVSFDRTAVLAKIKPIPSVTSVINANNCGPGNLELSATVSGGIVNWFADANAGSSLLTAPKYTTPSISNTTTYYAEALLDGCTSSPRTPVVATIFEVPTFKPLPDLFSLCAGLRLSLNNYVALGAPPYNYIFNTNNGNVMGQKDGYLLGVKGGITDVYFNVKDMNGCISQNTNSFQVKTYDPVKPKIFFQEAFYDFSTIIKTKVDSGYSVYDWSPMRNLDFYNDKDPVFRGINNVTYALYRQDTTSNCSVTDTYNITITTDFIFDLPNAFTPNFDGLNDVIKSMYNSGIASLNFLKIYNRNGNIVFQTSLLSAGWDGRVNGVDQDADAYFWTAEYVTRKSETFRKSGSFLLIK